MVMFIVNATPVWPSRMSLRTNFAGDFVGKGPSVSEFVTVQLLAELPLVDPVEVAVPVLVEVVGSISVWLQAARAAILNKLPNPRFKNSFRSIFILCDYAGKT
jgi:hypothetical protein